MPLTIADAEDSFLSAQAEVSEWRADFVRAWFKPYTDMALVMFWDRQPPAVHANLKAMDPASYAEVEQRVMKIKEGKNG